MKMGARPKKAAKPTTSVAVVRKMDEDWAGSRLRALRIIGIAAPDRPAATMFTTMARPITRERPALLLHTQTAAAVTTATAIPFNKPAKTSIFD
jgi:hypothetical protein